MSVGSGSAVIPARWEDLTPGAMTEALARHHPSAVVERVEVVTRDDGTNRRARLRLTYSAGTGPEYVFCKAEGDHREVHARNGNLFNEVDLFASEVELPVDHPFVYHVVTDRAALDHLTVMEDVTQRGGDPRDSTRPMNVAQAADGVLGLARLHSAFWGLSTDTHPTLEWLQTWEPTEGWQVGLRARVPTGLERAGEEIPHAIATRSGDQIVDAWARFVASLTLGPMTLLHADAHIGNTYTLPGDRVGFLDWQVVRRGNWSQDVGTFLMGAVTEDDRRACERDVLARYRDALDVPEAERPSLDEAWLRYRASAVYGLGIWLSTLGTDGYQRHEVSLALARRFATAAADLDSFAALDELESMR